MTIKIKSHILLCSNNNDSDLFILKIHYIYIKSIHFTINI